MPPIGPKNVISRQLNPHEGNPFSRPRTKYESTVRSDEEVEDQNRQINDYLYGSSAGESSVEVLRVGDFDSSINPEAIDGLNGESFDDNPGEILVSAGGVEDFQSKLGQESQHVGYEVMAALQGYGVPEEAISGDLNRVVNQRIFAKVEEIQNSFSDRLETDNIGGGVLPQDARIEVIRAVSAEELVRYYESNPASAMEHLSMDGVKAIHNNLAGDSYETRDNEDASHLGAAMDKISSSGATVKEIAQERAMEAVESSAEVSTVDVARESLDDVYAEMGVNLASTGTDGTAKESDIGQVSGEDSLDPAMTEGSESARSQAEAIRRMIDEMAVEEG